MNRLGTYRGTGACEWKYRGVSVCTTPSIYMYAGLSPGFHDATCIYGSISVQSVFPRGVWSINMFQSVSPDFCVNLMSERHTHTQ